MRFSSVPLREAGESQHGGTAVREAYQADGPGGAQALGFTGHYSPKLVEKCSHKLGLVVHARKTRQEGHCE